MNKFYKIGVLLALTGFCAFVVNAITSDTKSDYYRWAKDGWDQHKCGKPNPTKEDRLSAAKVDRYFELKNQGYITKDESRAMRDLLSNKLVNYEAHRALHPVATTILDILND